MKTIKIWSDSPSDKQLDEIVSELHEGGVIIYPTDTLYAIGCDALNSKAIERICKIKGINPEKSNLSIICTDISMASEYCKIANSAFKLLKELTPGPFTFLFKASSTLPKAFKGRKIVGIRIPENKTARRIAEYLGNPILSSSIEFDDDDEAINPDLISEKYSTVSELFIEGEEGETIPSTIIDFTENNPRIVREGKGIVEL